MTSFPVKILLVDDQPENLLAVEAILASPEYRMIKATSGEAALRCLLEHDFAVIVLDVHMPGLDGFETARLIKERERSQHTPIIFLTGSELDHEFRGYAIGAVDYLIKPVHPVVLKSKIAVFTELHLQKEQLTACAETLEQRVAEHTQQLQHQQETLQALYRASLEIQVPLTLQERLDRLLQAAKTLLELDRVSILLANPDGQWLQAVAILGVEEPVEAIRVPIGPEGGGLAQAYQTQQMVVRDGRSRVPAPLRLQPPYDRIKAFRSQVFAIVPLVVQGRAIGVLGADRKHSRRPFDPTTRDLLQLFATQAALAIDQARLYEAQRTAAIQLEATVEDRTQELKAANVRLEEASRHKSEFLANMSHELRTPLNSVIGFSELLLERTVGALNEKQTRFLTNIQSSGKHLVQLISDILDLSKVEAGKVVLHVEPLPVAMTLEDILVIARGLAHQKRQTVETQIDPDLPPLQADPIRFKQILFNLLSNAVKFTPDGGLISVAARLVHSSPFTVDGPDKADRELSTVNREQRGEFIEIAVADTGIGITAEDLPRLFQEFVQLEAAATKRYEGTGLGLVLTRRLVELHGGRIWAESAGQGRGSTFTFALPFAGPGEGPDASAEAPT